VLFGSPYPAIPPDRRPLPLVVLEHAERFGDRPALIDSETGRRISYARLAQDVHRVSAGLARRGVRAGDVVGLWSANHPEFAVACNAAWMLGATVTMLGPLLTTEEAARQLRETRAKYLIAGSGLVGDVASASAGAGLRATFGFGEPAGATPFAALLREDGAPPGLSFDPAAQPAAILYSSGTTGLPKGVVVTHANLVAGLHQLEVAMPGEGATTLAALPLSHIAGLQAVLNLSLRTGGTVVTLPRSQPETFLDALQDHRVTRVFLAPPLVKLLATLPLVDHYDLSALQTVVSAAAPLTASAERACGERLGCLVAQAYGLTEASGPVMHNPLDPARARPGSVGVLVPGTACMVLDPETGDERGPDQAGELWVRGPQVMRGYLGEPEATAQALSADGWLRTGDLGYADADGYFYILDRLKDMIKYRGYQVSPAELERILLDHQAVAEAVVVPSPDDDAGEVPHAYVTLRRPVLPEDLLAYVAARVAPYKKVRRLEVVSQIPTLPSGKVLRRLLIDRERRRADHGIAADTGSPIRMEAEAGNGLGAETRSSSSSI
jgi:acyl-CoA synthetase (AMP-forming)/AMP-acid ligase II